MSSTTGVRATSADPVPVKLLSKAQAPAGSTISIVIPALNEAANIRQVLASVPRRELGMAGWDVEAIVVDNASTDGTGELAREMGATVVVQPHRGYGHAYRAGFRAARGAVVATADADRTYPLEMLPTLLDYLFANDVDFLSTNRLGQRNRSAMKRSHLVGNRLLSSASSLLFMGSPFSDSQSGMWVFRRAIWKALDVRSTGMSFSQEIKNEAYLKGFRCDEVSIEYRARGGEVKLRAVHDGLRNASHLVAHRARGRRRMHRPAVIDLRDPHVATPGVGVEFSDATRVLSSPLPIEG